MSVINTGKTFANGEQLTADKLNQVIDQATFNLSEAVDGSTITLISGAMAVNDNGITEAKIDNGAVTKNKIENVTDMTVLGNTSGSDTAPQEVSILDEDDMNSDSDTALATQQSIKAYVDGNFQARAGCVYDPKNDNILYSNGISGVVKNSTGNYTVTLSNAAPSAYFPVYANAPTRSGQSKNYSTGAESTSTTTIDVNTEDSNGAAFDLEQISIVAHW
jgi:hypothetical protein